MKWIKDITAAPTAWYPRPATTPQRFEQFRRKLLELDLSDQFLPGRSDLAFGNFLDADPHKEPFFVRLCTKIPVGDRRAAYLWLADGQPEWRFAACDRGIETCPVVYHAPLTRILDDAFAEHWRKIRKKAKQPPFQPPTPVAVADRLDWVGTNFLCGCEPDRDELLWQDLAVMVHQVDSCYNLADECSRSLGADKGKLRVKEVGPKPWPWRILAIHFKAEVFFLDIELPGSPALNVLRCVNGALYPHYEIRKHRHSVTRESAFTMPGKMTRQVSSPWAR